MILSSDVLSGNMYGVIIIYGKVMEKIMKSS
jgi:hypothetical protein